MYLLVVFLRFPRFISFICGIRGKTASSHCFRGSSRFFYGFMKFVEKPQSTFGFLNILQFHVFITRLSRIFTVMRGKTTGVSGFRGFARMNHKLFAVSTFQRGSLMSAGVLAPLRLTTWTYRDGQKKRSTCHNFFNFWVTMFRFGLLFPKSRGKNFNGFTTTRPPREAQVGGNPARPQKIDHFK